MNGSSKGEGRNHLFKYWTPTRDIQKKVHQSFHCPLKESAKSYLKQIFISWKKPELPFCFKNLFVPLVWGKCLV